MKNIFKFLAIALFVGTFVSCDEDLIVFDAENGQTALSFAATSFNLSIPTEGLTVEVPVQSTTSSASDRTFTVTVDLATGGSGEYTIGTITIPANSFLGTLSVAFNFDAIDGPDGEVKDLVISLDVPEGGASYDDIVSFSYFREIVCNDIEVQVITDFWGDETSWEITDSTGAVVASGGPYPQVEGAEYNTTHFLENGTYTFTFFDAFGDGQVNGAFLGSYAVTCSILQHASGSGVLDDGTFESTEFTVNP